MPSFQGKDVALTKLKFTGGAKEVHLAAPTIDQIVSITFDGRVSGVEYKVNEQTGDLEEIVSVRIIDVEDVTNQSYPNLVSVNGKQVDPATGEVVNG